MFPLFLNSCECTHAYLLELQLAGLMVELSVFLMASRLAAMMEPLWALLKASLEIVVQENKHIRGFIYRATALQITGQNYYKKRKCTFGKFGSIITNNSLAQLRPSFNILQQVG